MYSQAFQDEFVDIVLDRPSSGYFVDVGAGCDDENGKGSNTLMFEKRGWDGICIDELTERLKGRSCKCVTSLIGDGLENTRLLSDVLNEINSPMLVDYLSIDIEGHDYKALKSFIEGGYTFKVATVEHNLYSRNPGVDELKQNIFSLMSTNGYVRVVDNAGHMACKENLHRGYAFEDWYINPKYVSYQGVMTKIQSMKESIL